MTETRLPWFHCYPEKWLGALAGMPPDQGYVYIVVCLRIYEKRGPISDDVDALARRTGYRPSHVGRLLEKLISTGKLVRTSDGGLMNPFAEKMMRVGEEKVSQTRKVRSRAAKISWEKRKGKQRPAGARAKQKAADLDLDIEGTPKKESPTDVWPEDFVEQFWNAYPKARRTARKHVAAKLATIRRSGDVPWAKLMAGLARYAATDDVARGFACAPVVWLNGGRWDDEVQPRGGRDGKNGNGGSARGGGYSSLAARIRAGRGPLGAGEASAEHDRPGDGRAPPAGDMDPGGRRLL